MTLTATQWQDWLRADAVDRTVLVEANAWDFGSASVVTYRWSNSGWISASTDSPASTPYDDRLVDMPGLRAAIPDSFVGQASMSYGDIELDNADGGLDALLSKSFDGRILRVYLGQRDWPLADFVVVYVGIVADVAMPSPERVTLKVRDQLYKLQATTLTGNYLAGQLIPQTYGAVFNVKPILADSATRKYQVHDGAIFQITAVRSRGVVLSTSNYTVNASAGTFTTATNYQDITCDVNGSATGGTYVYKVGDIVSRILTERGGFVAGDIDTSYFSSTIYVAGTYITEQKTAAAFLDGFVTGAGYVYFSSRAGKIRMVSVIDGSTAGYSITIGDDDLVGTKPIRLTKRLLPWAMARAGYKRNWSPLSTVADAVAAADADLLKGTHSIATASNGGLKYLLAPTPDVLVGPYLDYNPALADATARAAFFSRVRHVWTLTVGLIGAALNLGEAVRIDTSYTLANGFGVVVGVRDSLLAGRVEIDVLV